MCYQLPPDAHGIAFYVWMLELFFQCYWLGSAKYTSNICTHAQTLTQMRFIRLSMFNLLHANDTSINVGCFCLLHSHLCNDLWFTQQFSNDMNRLLGCSTEIVNCDFYYDNFILGNFLWCYDSIDCGAPTIYRRSFNRRDFHAILVCFFPLLNANQTGLNAPHEMHSCCSSFSEWKLFALNVHYGLDYLDGSFGERKIRLFIHLNGKRAISWKLMPNAILQKIDLNLLYFFNSCWLFHI